MFLFFFFLKFKLNNINNVNVFQFHIGSVFSSIYLFSLKSVISFYSLHLYTLFLNFCEFNFTLVLLEIEPRFFSTPK